MVLLDIFTGNTDSCVYLVNICAYLRIWISASHLTELDIDYTKRIISLKIYQNKVILEEMRTFFCNFLSFNFIQILHFCLGRLYAVDTQVAAAGDDDDDESEEQPSQYFISY